jgi:hypothetical protein
MRRRFVPPSRIGFSHRTGAAPVERLNLEETIPSKGGDRLGLSWPMSITKALVLKPIRRLFPQTVFFTKVSRATIRAILATSFSTTRGGVRRRYKRSPIAEAVCEFQFRGSSEWDWTILGLVYQEIKSEFPQKRQEKAFEINIAPQEGKIEKSVGGSLSKMQFLREDGSAMVQVGPDLLAINVLPPYPGWETFEALIRRQFEIYCKIAHPVGFKRIGLRFINKIAFPTKEIETTEYFYY